MHEWQGYEKLDAFSSGCTGSTPHTAAKLTGGIQWFQAYTAAANDKQIIIGGSSGVSRMETHEFIGFNLHQY